MVGVRGLKILFIAGAVGILLVVGWFLKKSEEATLALGEIKGKIDGVSVDGASVTGLELTQSKDGKPLWVLKAQRAEQHNQGKMATATDLKVTLFQKDGRPVLITSNRGEVLNDGSLVRFLENVVVDDPDGRRLTTEALSFRPEENRIFTELFFRFTGPGYQLEGVGMELLTEVKHLTVEREVRFLHFKNAPKGDGA